MKKKSNKIEGRVRLNKNETRIEEAFVVAKQNEIKIGGYVSRRRNKMR